MECAWGWAARFKASTALGRAKRWLIKGSKSSSWFITNRTDSSCSSTEALYDSNKVFSSTQTATELIVASPCTVCTNSNSRPPGRTASIADRMRPSPATILAVAGDGLIRSAMDAVRPGGRELLFVQTVHGEATINSVAVCVDEKTLLESYSASVELQEESVRFVMNHELDLEPLISHRFALPSAVEALNLAAHPQAHSMKIVIQPGSSWEGRSD